MMDGIGHGWGMGFGWLIGIAILVLIIWITIRLARHNYHSRSTSDTSKKSPLDILKDRYVRGEIDKSEFEEKRRDLLS